MIKEAIDRIIPELNDILAEAHVSEPAGRGCGYSVEYDEQALRNVMANILIEEAHKQIEKNAVMRAAWEKSKEENAKLYEALED